MYHHISDLPPRNALDLSLTVTPTVFGQQLDYLKTKGYHSITFNQLFNALYYQGPLPSKPIILTFDDGYEDNYQFAYPLLREHGFSGMFYIITGKVNWEGQMTWGQLREMLQHGMQMGSHTIHHVNMGQVWQNSPEQAQQELQISKSTLEQNLRIVVQQFCYPSGEPFRSGSRFVRQQIVLLLAQDGYVGATTDPGITGIVQQSQEPFILLRIRVDGRESFEGFVKSLPW
jgi:peptidoglycan/xylan/chitin deacetylase (PgdA/CDA1 family)